MPVLSDQPHQSPKAISHLPGAKVIYLLLGLLFIFSLTTYLTRRPRSSSKHPKMTLPTHDEKALLLSQTPPSPKQTSRPTKPRITHPGPPPPPQTSSFSPLPSPSSEIDYYSASDPDAPPPRRRSYTKASPDGEVTVSGEIIVAEGWRRHTRVFGGGVCKACEESERRMSA